MSSSPADEVIIEAGQPADLEPPELTGWDFPSAKNETLKMADLDLEDVASVSTSLIADLVAIDTDDRIVNALEVRFDRRIEVGSLVTLSGSDASGALRVFGRLMPDDPPTLRFNLRYTPGGQATPAELLPVFRFLRSLQSPNSFGIVINGRRIGEPEALPPDAPEITSAQVELMAALAFVQEVTKCQFALPEALSLEDRKAIQLAERLLRGETVEGHWDHAELSVDIGDPELVEAVAVPGLLRLELVRHVGVSISGSMVSLGEVQHVFRSAVLVNAEELLKATESGDHEYAVAKLRPAHTDVYERRLLNVPERPPGDLLARPMRLDPAVLEGARSRPSRLGLSAV